MPRIELTNLTKRWGNFYAVDNLNLVIEDNSFITLLGPSGCGKTTTLRMIAGLETPTSGRIKIGDQTVFDSETGINVPANKRRVGFLFQNYALWPNMTVYDNIAFGLKNVREMLPVVDDRARRYSKIISILEKPEKVIILFAECLDNKNRLNKERALIRLIDYFEISIYTARIIGNIGLHQASDTLALAEKCCEQYKIRLKNLLSRIETQGYSLNDHFEVIKDGSVLQKVRKLTKEEIDLTVRRVARVVKISELMNRYPSELSGGQQQRVAIARTLAPEPVVLFMDEPLSNLDAKLRLEMRSELQRLHIDTGSTFVYVTHDQLEAMTLATKICLINNGVLQQYDRPLDVYKKPVNLFAADFVGNPSINFIEASGHRKEDGTFTLSFFGTLSGAFRPADKLNQEGKAQTDASPSSDGYLSENARKDKHSLDKVNKDQLFKYHIAKVTEGITTGESMEQGEGTYVIGIRPEFIRISPEGKGAIKGKVYSVMPAGMETTVKIEISNYLLTGVAFGGIAYRIGEEVNLDFIGNEIMLFDRSSGKMISLGSFEVN